MARRKFDRSLIPPSPDLSFELALWQQDITLVAGIDEAGRGSLAGPVAVGAVILPVNLPDLATRLPGVRDSKQLTAPKRKRAALLIKHVAFAWAVGLADSVEIDQLGIAPATRLAAMRAIKQLAFVPQHLLIDYINLPESELPQTSLVKGDQRSLSIACASILAKTTRDELMVRLSEQYPIYGFACHKGYGTATHLAVIQACGPCPIHRRSFSPVSQPNS
jgi:ribonuclease HII